MEAFEHTLDTILQMSVQMVTVGAEWTGLVVT